MIRTAGALIRRPGMGMLLIGATAFAISLVCAGVYCAVCEYPSVVHL